MSLQEYNEQIRPFIRMLFAAMVASNFSDSPYGVAKAYQQADEILKQGESQLRFTKV